MFTVDEAKALLDKMFAGVEALEANYPGLKAKTEAAKTFLENPFLLWAAVAAVNLVLKRLGIGLPALFNAGQNPAGVANELKPV